LTSFTQYGKLTIELPLTHLRIFGTGGDVPKNLKTLFDKRQETDSQEHWIKDRGSRSEVRGKQMQFLVLSFWF
jgi:hypothetical protein